MRERQPRSCVPPTSIATAFPLNPSAADRERRQDCRQDDGGRKDRSPAADHEPGENRTVDFRELGHCRLFPMRTVDSFRCAMRRRSDAPRRGESIARWYRSILWHQSVHGLINETPRSRSRNDRRVGPIPKSDGRRTAERRTLERWADGYSYRSSMTTSPYANRCPTSLGSSALRPGPSRRPKSSWRPTASARPAA